MTTPDVNVLVAAFRADHAHHKIARRWLNAARRQCAQGTEPQRLLPMVVSGFLRIVTSARVFEAPDTVASAVAFLDILLETPGAEIQSCGEEWPLLREKLLMLELGGNLVSDAWIAAAVQASSDHLVTFDRDFARLLPSSDFTLLGPAARRD